MGKMCKKFPESGILAVFVSCIAGMRGLHPGVMSRYDTVNEAGPPPDEIPIKQKEEIFVMSKLNELAVCVESGNVAEVVALTKAALEEGVAPLDVLNTGLVEPINVLGEKFRLGQVYVPEL